MSRLHSMDALRAIAMFLGVVLHALMSYQVTPRAGWPQDPKFQNITYDFFYHWIHSFRMPLFFLVAGFFARFLYYKIGYKSFLKHRYKRIFIPFIVSIFVLLPISILPFQYYKLLPLNLSFGETFQAAIHHSLGWNGFIHLWFLYYLMIMYALMLILIRIGAYISISWVKDLQFSYLPIPLLRISLITTGVLFFFHGIRIEPWTGAMPKLGQLLYYGLFFFLGYTMNRNINSLNSGQYYTYIYLILGTLLQFILFAFEKNMGESDFTLPLKLLYNTINALQTVLLTFGMLSLFMKLFKGEHRFIRYFSDASYWIYLIHLPIVVIMQVLLLELNYGSYFKFILILITTTLVSLVTYQLFVRYSIIGEYLHGKRQKKILDYSIKS